MENEVYIDLLFLINFSMDYLCLYISAKILGRKMSAIKYTIASALGGAYSVVSLFLALPSLPSLLLDIMIGLMLCAVAFCHKGESFRNYITSSLLFVGVSMMTGGCMTALFNLLNRLDLPTFDLGNDSISVWAFALLALVAGIVTLAGGKLISSKASVKECEVIIDVNGKTQNFHALCDSGNLVRDPISGRAVIFIDENTASDIIDLEMLDKYKNGEPPIKKKYKHLCLIPIRTVSGNTLACALLPDKITISLEAQKKKVSFSADALISVSKIKNDRGDYDAILPSEILKY